MQPILTEQWFAENYLKSWEQFLNIIKDLVKETGYFVFKSDAFTAREVYNVTQKYFKRLYTIVWDKGCIGLGRRWRPRHEIIEIYGPIGGKGFWSKKRPRDFIGQNYHTFKTLTGDIVKSKIEKKWHGGSKELAFQSILHVPIYNNGNKGKKKADIHINRTPPELWTYFLEYMCPKDGLILDPFMGSASVGEAIRILNKRGTNRTYWGIEINAEYFKLAKYFMQTQLDNFANKLSSIIKAIN